MRSNPDLDALVRRAEEAGAKVLTIRLPDAGPGPFPACQENGPIPRPSKYGNVRTEYAGIGYDSKVEADYAASLDDQMRLSPGMWWIRQPTFRLGCVENVYRPDFLVYRPEWSANQLCVVDVKGVRTAKFNHDLKLWAIYGPCPLYIVKRAGHGWQSEVIRGGTR